MQGGYKVLRVMWLLWVLTGACIGATPAEATAWVPQGFQGQRVSAVFVDEQRPNQVAALVQGTLWLTRDKGILWRAASVAQPVNRLAFHPTDPALLYAATAVGVYRSADFGHSWQRLMNVETAYRAAYDVAVTEDAVYALSGSGGGTPSQLVRMGLSGEAATIESHPAQFPWLISYSSDHRELYIAWRDGVAVRSSGVWRHVTPPGSQQPRALYRSDTRLWVLADNGIYRADARAATWERISSSTAVGGQTYNPNNSYGVGIVAQDEVAWHGVVTSIGSGNVAHVVRNASGAIGSVNASPPSLLNYLAGGQQTLWAATVNGVWSSEAPAAEQLLPRRPVVLIPGILGSWPTARKDCATCDNGLILDPIKHTYDQLVAYLQSRGYESGKTLFVYPYDWRRHNDLSAQGLSRKIESIKQICTCNGIDIVAHSMGGLIARSYVQGPSYRQDVIKLIQVGTPNNGSVKAYPVYQAGLVELLDKPLAVAAQLVLRIEAARLGYGTVAEYLRGAIPSVGQLLPVGDYLQGRIYPIGYPRNEWLEALNRGSLPPGLALYTLGANHIMTPQRLIVGEPSKLSALWPHGKLLQAIDGPGDGTVTSASAELLRRFSVTIPDNHGGIMSHYMGMAEVGRILLGDTKPSAPKIPEAPLTHVVSVGGDVKASLRGLAGRELGEDSENLPGYASGGVAGQAQLFAIREVDAREGATLELVGKPGVEYMVAIGADDDHRIAELKGVLVGTTAEVTIDWVAGTVKLQLPEAPMLSKRLSFARLNPDDPILVELANFSGYDVAGQRPNTWMPASPPAGSKQTQLAPNATDIPKKSHPVYAAIIAAIIIGMSAYGVVARMRR